MVPFNFGFWQAGGVYGSVNIGGNVSNAYLSTPASSDWAVGTGDFTIEWFQYSTSYGNENFVFNVGSNTIAVSQASGGGKMNLYVGGTRSQQTVSITLATWYHVAVSRTSSTLNFYFNGSRISSVSNSTNINDSSSTLYIGQNNLSANKDSWTGNITNFRWVKGTGLYTNSTLTIPTTNLTAVANTKLLLLFQNSAKFLTDSSGTGKVITNAGVPTWSSLKPF